MKFIIKGENGNFELSILHRNYPDSTDYYDANWLTTEINIQIPGYTASFSGDILAFEIENFAQQIKQMYSAPAQNVSFSSMEGLVAVKAKMDKLGHIDWEIETMYPVGIGTKLVFSLSSDQSYLPKLITELEMMAQEFPVIKGDK